MTKIVFCNTSWMRKYQGNPEEDRPRRGGAWVEDNGWDHAMLNFLPERGYCYGFVQTKGDRLNLKRIAPGAEGDRLDGVLVVWVATSERYGSVIVGWYENATVWRRWQKRSGPTAKYKGNSLGYLMRAKAKDCHLLRVPTRRLRIPHGRGWMGQSNVWYADQPGHEAFRGEILKFVDAKGKVGHSATPKKSPSGAGYQADVRKRLAVEAAAMKAARRFYANLGYSVEEVDREKLGWDLRALREDEELSVEVKGISGSEVLFEITPNEYKQMLRLRGSYEVFVLTNALWRRAQKEWVFHYNKELCEWVHAESGRILRLDKVTSARASFS